MQYYDSFLDQLKLMEQPRSVWPGFPRQSWPAVRNHTDPTDILKPEVYDLQNPVWFNPHKQGRIAQFCENRARSSIEHMGALSGTCAATRPAT